MTRARHPNSYQMLNKAFLAKQDKNPAYSQRALARDLGLSPAFVTKVLTGQKPVPNERYKDFFKVLEMDITLQASFMKAVVLESLPNEEMRYLVTKALLDDSKMEFFTRETSKKFRALKHWYCVPILTYLASESNDSSPAAIARYFGLTEKECSLALLDLQKQGLIKNQNGAWLKVDAFSYFPTTQSHEEVRDFHRQMIQKAYRELSKTSHEDFEKRLITGFSIATNPKNIQKAKTIIAEFLAQISHVASEGEDSEVGNGCNEVYQCNVQFFPLKAQKIQKGEA